MKVNNKWEILTDHGDWSDFSGIMRSTKKLQYVRLSKNKGIWASRDHIFFINKIPTKLKYIPKISEVDGINGSKIRIEKTNRYKRTYAYDIVGCDNTSYQYVIEDKILTHNCDEFAFVRPNIQDEFWTSISPTLACIAGDTMILTEKGFRKIEEFHKDRSTGEYFKIKNTKIWGKFGIEPLSHGYVSPDSKTLIIKTRTGLEVEVTLDHPLYTLTNQNASMIKAKDLNLGNYLRIDYEMEQFGNDRSIDEKYKLTEEIAYMLGVYIAEGWIHKKTYGIYISNGDQEIKDKFLNSTFVKQFKSTSSEHKILCSSKELVEYYKKLGIDPDKKCFNKEVPSSIFKAPKNIVAGFLSGLFDGDGCVTPRSINLTSTSKKLVQQVQLLLLNFGVVSQILVVNPEKILAREKKNNRILPHGKPLQSLRTAYSLNIPRSHFKKFYDDINFGLTRKAKKLQALSEKFKDEEQKQYKIPTIFVLDKLKTIFKDTKKGEVWFRRKGLRIDRVIRDYTKKKNINTFWIRRLEYIILCNFPDVHAKHKSFFDEFSGNCFWDDIVSITPSKNKTYDFTVPNTHTFLQNGILGSNTGGSCIVTSTPNNDDDIFATLWNGAELGVNGFYPITVEWTETPGRDEKFKEQEIGKIGQRKWDREYELKFISADDLLIDAIVLNNLKEKTKRIEPIREIKEIKFFKEIEKDKTYIVGVDPATGVSKDFSVFEVYELPTMIQVAEYRSNNTSTNDLYILLKNLLLYLEKRCKEVYFSVEANGVGEGVISLYEADEKAPMGAEFVSEEGPGKRGFTTTPKSKRKYCVVFKEAIEKNRTDIRSKVLVTELKSFVRKLGSFSARIGASDDTISASLVCMRIIDTMATFDPDAFEKLYGIEEHGDWSDDETGEYTIRSEDDEPLPMTMG